VLSSDPDRINLTSKEKERQKVVLSGTMVVGLAVNCGMLPWLFKEHLPGHLSQSEMMPTILLMKAMSEIPVAGEFDQFLSSCSTTDFCRVAP